MMLALFTSLAAAQSIPGTEGYQAPELGVDLYRPSVDSLRTLQVEDTHKPEAFTAGLSTWWVRDPLVWYNSEGETTRIVGDAMGVAATASVGLGPVRLGVVTPAWVHSTGTDGARGGTLGDPSLDVRVARSRQGFGFGAGGRLTAPLGASAHQLGQAGWSYEVLAIADYSGDRFWVGANLGARGLPEVDLVDVQMNDQLLYRAGAAWTPAGPWSVAAELQGMATWSTLQSGAVGNPREILISGRRSGAHYQSSLGVGVGQGAGIGAPRWRVVFSMRAVD